MACVWRCLWPPAAATRLASPRGSQAPPLRRSSRRWPRHKRPPSSRRALRPRLPRSPPLRPRPRPRRRGSCPLRARSSLPPPATTTPRST
ncbi:MAG: hypothetical protein AMJ77_01670 [Dehalococcoidia bacterium SM23_28_2]|nr:MAG: hypothetical protein AMJ77_01670 [Dehalococcoidia bacterium SM23_28_2]